MRQTWLIGTLPLSRRSTGCISDQELGCECKKCVLIQIFFSNCVIWLFCFIQSSVPTYHRITEVHISPTCKLILHPLILLPYCTTSADATTTTTTTTTTCVVIQFLLKEYSPAANICDVYRAIGLVLDSIHRLVCGSQKTTTFRRLDLSPSSGGWGGINLLS
jgi:hypothetical protein